MKQSRAASRYAKSLLDLSIEQNSLDEAFADMTLVANTIEGSKELDLLLQSPVVKSDKKQDILNAVFAGKIGKVANGFISIVVTNGRESILKNISNQFIAQYKAHKNITTAEVTTAVAMDDTLRNKVLEIVKKTKGNTQVEIIEKVDSSIIGGLIVRLGDEQVDASIARKLNDLKQEFSKSPQVAEA